MTTKLLHNEHLVLASNQIHISSESPNDYEVWLNTDVGDFDGLCIGCGASRKAAITDALYVLESGVQALKDAGDNEPAQAASGG